MFIDQPRFVKSLFAFPVLTLFLSPILGRALLLRFSDLRIDDALDSPLTASKHGCKLAVTISFLFEKFYGPDLIRTELSAIVIFSSGDVYTFTFIWHCYQQLSLT